MYNDNSSPMVTNCIFTGNTAEWYGGGMGNWNHSSPMVTNCTFADNSAWTGGGIYNANYSSPEVTNCIFINNMSTAYGGGMYNELESIPTVTNCTFTGNSAWDGGGIFGESDVINCISWDNTANSPSDPFHEIYLATVTFSNIKGGYLGANNIDSDPMFADVDGRLLPGSPCIDAGTDAAVSSLTDHDGNSRIVGAAVDMGAFEAQPATLIATTALLIIDEVEDGSVDSRIERSLLAKLDVALVAVEKGNVTGAVNQLKSLVKLLEAQAGKTTTEDAAEEIITELNTIIDELSS